MAQLDTSIPMSVRSFNLGSLADSFMVGRKFKEDLQNQALSRKAKAQEMDFSKNQETRAQKVHDEELTNLAQTRKEKRRAFLNSMLGEEAEILGGLAPEKRKSYFTEHLVPSLKDDGFDVSDFGDYDDGLIDTWRQLALPPEKRKANATADGHGSQQPFNWLEWEKYSKLPPEERAQYLEMKRAQKTLDLGGSHVTLAPGGVVGNTFPKTLKPGELPAVKGAQAAAVAAGTESVTGKAAREQAEFAEKHKKALAANASQVQDLESFASMVDKVAKNPNLAGATGWGQYGRFLPGSPWADVNADINRIVGSAAIETMAKLKRESPTGSTGFGALSEKELKVLQDAFSALQDRNISPTKMREELGRVKSVTSRYLQNIRKFQGAAPAGPGAVGRFKVEVEQ